jgi:tRNA pseudouridine13 synthase
MQGIPHRYLTERYSGVGGVIKRDLDDFRVTEVPLYHPVDHGEHTYFEIEKVDLSTLEAVQRICVALGIRTRDLGYAGLKDRRGITRQVMSVRLVPPDRVRAMHVSQLKVLWTRLHTNKLRVGHLRGNRFRIRVRDVGRGCHAQIEKIVDLILRRGLPNYFGPQRFGRRGDAFHIGRALLLRDHDDVVRRILGYPSCRENNPHVVLARFKFMEGDLDGALRYFPKSYREERRLLHYLRQSKGNYRGAVKRLKDEIKRIYYSAFQSYLFNRILDRRLALTGGRLDRLYSGDLALLHRNNAVFRVIDPTEETPRSASFEISPTGPLFGKMMAWPNGIEESLERDAIARFAVQPSTFHQLMPALHMRGARRAFRVQVRELVWELDGRDLVLQFFLPKGSYATTLLREILKTDDPPLAYYTNRPEDLPIPTGIEEDEPVIP